jgi:hypothetical protein
MFCGAALDKVGERVPPCNTSLSPFGVVWTKSAKLTVAEMMMAMARRKGMGK